MNKPTIWRVMPPVNTTIETDKQEIMKASTTTLVDEEIEPEKGEASRLEELGVTNGSGRFSVLRGTSRRTQKNSTEYRNHRQVLCNNITQSLPSVDKTRRWLSDRGTELQRQCPESRDVETSKFFQTMLLFSTSYSSRIVSTMDFIPDRQQDRKRLKRGKKDRKKEHLPL